VGFLFFNIFIDMDEKRYNTISKFLDITDKELMDIYYSLRLMFMREGWTEEDLKSIPYYPRDIMTTFQKFSQEKDRLFFEVKNFFNLDHNEFIEHLQQRMKEIDKKTPL
jgi:hypothetical protein